MYADGGVTSARQTHRAPVPPDELDRYARMSAYTHTAAHPAQHDGPFMLHREEGGRGGEGRSGEGEESGKENKKKGCKIERILFF